MDKFSKFGEKSISLNGSTSYVGICRLLCEDNGFAGYVKVLKRDHPLLILVNDPVKKKKNIKFVCELLNHKETSRTAMVVGVTSLGRDDNEDTFYMDNLMELEDEPSNNGKTKAWEDHLKMMEHCIFELYKKLCFFEDKNRVDEELSRYTKKIKEMEEKEKKEMEEAKREKKMRKYEKRV